MQDGGSMDCQCIRSDTARSLHSGQAAQGAGTLVQHCSALLPPAGMQPVVSPEHRSMGRTSCKRLHTTPSAPRAPRTPENLVLEVLEHVTFMARSVERVILTEHWTHAVVLACFAASQQCHVVGQRGGRGGRTWGIALARSLPEDGDLSAHGARRDPSRLPDGALALAHLPSPSPALPACWRIPVRNRGL